MAALWNYKFLTDKISAAHSVRVAQIGQGTQFRNDFSRYLRQIVKFQNIFDAYYVEIYTIFAVAYILIL
jgi:hypothetical protein